MAKTFLKAEWRKLAMVNYAVDPEVLQPYVPYGTELDLFNDTCYVSLVGFRFVNTRVKGFRIPYHVNFEEVNLRFYVRYKDGHEWKRGVVFFREIVPRRALTFIANTIYKEKYATMPMGNTCSFEGGCVIVEYTWRKGKWHSIRVNCSADPQPITPGSEEEFITEHYWGYTKITNNSTSEYGVEHPRWEVYPMKEITPSMWILDCCMERILLSCNLLNLFPYSMPRVRKLWSGRVGGSGSYPLRVEFLLLFFLLLFM